MSSLSPVSLAKPPVPTRTKAGEGRWRIVKGRRGRARQRGGHQEPSQSSHALSSWRVRRQTSANMSMIEALQYLSRSDSDDEEDDTDRRPTPLDPEYWRGITHSYETVAPHAVAVQHHDVGFGYPVPLHPGSEYPHPQMYSRPLTAPAYMNGAAFNNGSLVPSPISFGASGRQLPISPMAHSDRMVAYGENPMARPYLGGIGVHDGIGQLAHGSRQGYGQEGGEWGYFPARGGYPPTGSTGDATVSPQSLRAELRNAFVHARAYLDLVPFFQSCDHGYSGGIPLRTLQDALVRMGIALTTQVLHGIGQLFGIPGSGMVDYTAFSRFLELDSHEMCVARLAASFAATSTSIDTTDTTAPIFLLARATERTSSWRCLRVGACCSTAASISHACLRRATRSAEGSSHEQRLPPSCGTAASRSQTPRFTSLSSCSPCRRTRPWCRTLASLT
ncbi:hypothetical protein PybrP1_002181 [[Pythium] brassicae (nom. inval.)]|nr:hypothetical protein PybrP1_002181 [[Pythium] brassicae (nom. inval.)]